MLPQVDEKDIRHCFNFTYTHVICLSHVSSSAGYVLVLCCVRPTACTDHVQSIAVHEEGASAMGVWWGTSWLHRYVHVD